MSFNEKTTFKVIVCFSLPPQTTSEIRHSLLVCPEQGRGRNLDRLPNENPNTTGKMRRQKTSTIDEREKYICK